MPRAFVIRPFGTKKDSTGKEIDFEKIHDTLIQPALTASGLEGSTTGEIIDSGNIREDMFALILEADLVICDITIHNANVFYELGIRHALRKKRTILIKGGPTKDSTPFDILTDRYLYYELVGPEAKVEDLKQIINASMTSERDTDSPIFKMLPALPEADPETVQVVPMDFQEEVERAKAIKARGWLRLLADEVKGMRFERPGSKIIGKALWDARDYVAARKCYEEVLDTHPQDIEANLALSNIYERLSRDKKNVAKQQQELLLELSNQAIDRVVNNPDTPAKARVEALTLKGRNLKTSWRLQFAGIDDPAKRGEAAMNEKLRTSFEAYSKAFQEDLNHFYSGLAAWQMGRIFLELAGESDDWKFAFDDDNQADAFQANVQERINGLSHIVPASVRRSLKKLKKEDEERIWAEISNCDVLFLQGQPAKRLAKRYRDAIPDEKSFAWSSAKGQLELFASLGIQADLALAVIAAVDPEMAEQKDEEQKPLHMILFAGHLVDEPGRPEARFPEDKVDTVRQLVKEKIEELQDVQSKCLGLASAGPGGDILFHEICGELGIQSFLCLPAPAAEYAKVTFQEKDTWRTRFLELITEDNVMELSHQEGLPRWLEGTQKNSWERGNQWVLQMALASQASKVTLIAFWDQKPQGDFRGGTAHMVQLARDAGTIDVRIIDAMQILDNVNA